MNLASISENLNIEKRIAITPEIAKKYISLGFNLILDNEFSDIADMNNDFNIDVLDVVILVNQILNN